MNEGQNRGTVGEAIVGIVFIFSILLFLLFRFGTESDSVTNPLAQNTKEITREEFLERLSGSSTQSDLYNSYLKQVYETQSNGTDSIEKQKKIEEIVNNYQNTLEEKVNIPTQNVTLKNVSDKFDAKYYEQNFEIIFGEFKKRGGTAEGGIIQAQIGADGTLLVLSPYDKESLLRAAAEYDILAEKLQNLSTPKSLEKIATEIAATSLNISYILKKMSEENDTKIYSLWISKYAENMSVIIADRYALHAK
jgi:hypothetical protein